MRALLPRSHQFLLEDAAALVRQRHGVGPVAVVGDTLLNLDVESWVAFDRHDHRQRVANLDQAVNARGERALADLDVHRGRGRVAAETDDLSVQHVDVEGVSDRLLQRSFPEASDGSRSIPNLIQIKF